MKVILLEEVERLGERGKVLNVADGYARNYLVPKKLAVAATRSSLKEWEEREKIVKRKEVKFKQDAEEIAQVLRKTVITMSVKAGEDGKLFGSITPSDIAKEIQKVRKIKIDKKKIVLEENVKKTGSYQVEIKLHQEVEAKIKLKVVAQETAKSEDAISEPEKTEEREGE